VIEPPLAVGPVLRINRPILDARGHRVGELTAFVSVNALTPADSARALVPGGQVAVRDRLKKTMLVPLRPMERYPEGAKTTIQGATWLVVHRVIEDSGLDLAVGAPLAPYVARFESAGQVGMVALLLVSLVAILVALLLTGRMVRPLENLAEASEAVARGNLEWHASPGGPIEVRRVGTAFNAMTGNLRRTLDQLSQRSALAAVGEFATSLSHDVRNALTSVRVDLERADRSRIAEPVPRKLVGRALGSVSRLETAVTGALQVARRATRR
jgi:signal transduction histidine kinase